MYATVNSSAGDAIKLSYPVGATGTYYCSYITNSGALMTEFGAISSGLDTLVPTPAAAGDTNQVRAISINGATSTVVLSILYFDPLGGVEVLYTITLATGDTLTYTADGSGWVVIDAMGHRL